MKYRILIFLLFCSFLFVQAQSQSVRKIKTTHTTGRKLGTVAKNADTLTVYLKNKKIIKYINKAHGDEVYSFIGNLGGTPYLLFRYQYQFGEVEGFLLVNNKNGNQCDVPGKPVLSPDSKRFAIASIDLEAKYNPNILVIYRLDKDSCRVEYSIEPADWGASKVRWINNNSVEYKKVTMTETGLKSEGKFILQLKNKRWQDK
jgi:hypothetical protein